MRRLAAALVVAAARLGAYLLHLPADDDQGAGDWP